MVSSFTLFEVSWEVCNKVGGIHTVLSTKAQTIVERFGDDYVAVGPWLLSESDREVPFDQDAGFEAFTEACREMGLPVRVGRWRIPGAPRTLLIESSRLYDERDGILSELWEDFGVDSITGSWDYVEPVLFGVAAGRVIEKWWEEYLAPSHRRAVVHAHEWMTGSAMLWVKKRVPSMGTVFTTHATMLGRALSSLGHSPEDGLGDQTPETLAETHGVVAKHSLEGVCAREADAFTTVSAITASEALLLHRRSSDQILPNGIDLDVSDALAGATTRAQSRAALERIASSFLGGDVSDAVFCCISGRYEFHNKGIDLLLDAVASLNESDGPRAVLFVLVPAGNSGVRSEVTERLEAPERADGPLGISTHNLFDPDNDAILVHCKKLGITNSADSRVKVIQIPIYLSASDGFLNLPYEALLRGMDVTCFPSYYEPWGYTPQESLAAGVPTITSDYAGFGRWALAEEVGPEHGLTVLRRVHQSYATVLDSLVDVLHTAFAATGDREALARTCRETAARTSWSDLVHHYYDAYAIALDGVQQRLARGVPQTRRPKKQLVQVALRAEEKPRLIAFDVSATLPESLRSLTRLAHNLWWSWDAEACSLFRELAPISWEACGHNPVRFLHRMYPEDLAAKASDRAYVERLKRVIRRFDEYVAADPAEGPWRAHLPKELQSALSEEHPVAYFCAEFGIHESLRLYSGGLGVLAGDHLKSASDLNVPLVAVGIFYRMGYMTQRISASGEQIAVDAENDPGALPLELVRTADGKPLELRLQLPGRELALRAWRVAVGRITLFLLDSNVPSNRQEDRDITKNLYGGEHETRLQQEIVLGRGGARLLRSLGIQPAAWHMNEGHAAFLTLERVGQLVKQEGLTFDEARELVRATTLFTTHTPVPAGHDSFGEDLMRRYFSDAPDWVGVPWETFIAFGRTREHTDGFNMTYLAVAFSAWRNGVSKLHGIASRQLLHGCWPGLLESEVPIRTVTNGIHLPTWTHPAVARALGVVDRPIRGEDFQAADGRTVVDLWKAKKEIKRDLIERVGVTLRRSFLERHDSPLVLNRMLDGLDENALLIGFARRFAPYKRAHLLFAEPKVLDRLLGDRERPLRILIAGKAHPKDEHGKDILRRISELTRSDALVGRVFFIEDYDMRLARALVQGVDVWLNNPTRMLEASGTSGMKAAANGCLNLSIGDGWWPEAYDGENGWQIAGDRLYQEQELQDQFDANALYRLLEDEVVPLYFDRDEDGVPAKWLARVRRSLETVPPAFNTDRMVLEYLSHAYSGLAGNFDALGPQRKNELKALVGDLHRIRRDFQEIRFVSVEVADLSDVKVGDAIDVRVEADLGALSPDEVTVELVLGHGPSGARGQDLQLLSTVPLSHRPRTEGKTRLFECSHTMQRSGSYAYGVRVRPRCPRDAGDALGDLVRWA